MAAGAYGFTIDAGFTRSGRLATLILVFRGLNAVHGCYGSDVRAGKCFDVNSYLSASLAVLHVS